jgi:hypothetical protein
MGKLKKKIEFTPEQEQQIKDFENYTRNHGKPVTRRQFLASGAMLGAASLILPSALSVISDMAIAQGVPPTVCKGAAGKMPGFISINLAGGASLAGNGLAKTKNGAMLSTYRPVGLGTTANAMAASEKAFGPNGPDFHSLGGFLLGLKTTAAATVLDRTAALLICVRSTDDSANNQLDPNAMIAKAKSGSGAFLPPLGTNRNQSAVLTETPALDVRSVADIQNAIGVQGAVQNLTAGQKEKIFKMVQRLSESQAAGLANASGNALLGDLVKSATGTNTKLIGNPSGDTDPQNVPGLNNVWNLNNATELRNAGVVMNTLKGHAVAGNIEMGGFDYHNQGRPNQDTRDNGAGQTVGRVLSTAAVMGEKVCVIVTSDGSVGHALDPSPGSGPTGDQGTHGMAYAFFFDPTKRPDQSASQVGGFTSSATNAGDRVGVDESTLIGGSPANAMAAIVANYLAFAGQTAMIESVAPRIFTVDQLDSQILKIG